MSEAFFEFGRKFFEIMGRNLEARKYLAYDSCFKFNCDDKSFLVKVKNKEIKALDQSGGSHFLGPMDLTIEGDEQTFVDLFRGRISPASAFYYGKLRIADQKSKHSQVVALFQAIRKTQEDLYIKD